MTILHPMQLAVTAYLQKANKGEASMADATLDLAAEQFRHSLNRQFNDPPREFRISLSQIGRPMCQLLHEKKGSPREDFPYSFKMNVLFGDMVEVAVKAILLESGVAFDASQNVVLKTPHGDVPGELDLIVKDKDDRVWDIKSCSPWAFNNKWSKGYEGLAEEDSFGYIHQLVGYSVAQDLNPGGWIVVNKANGEWMIVEFPQDQKIIREVLLDIYERVKILTEYEDGPITCAYPEVEETWYKKPTGNRHLSVICSMCPYKYEQWPNLQLAPNPKSKAREPQMRYYTHLVDETE